MAVNTASLLVIHATGTAGQSMLQIGAAPGFAPGGQDIFVLDLSATRVGTFPGTIQRLSGTLDVVMKDGRPMLRATEESEFLVTLSNVLPQDFTIEVDIVPRDGGPQPDLALEGTSRINQGAGSAHLLWVADPSYGFVSVIGGAVDNHEFPMPDDLRVTLPGALNRVGVRVQGGTIALYTNGRQLYSVQANFARGRYLRVTLGGVLDATGTHPVYVARVRVATGAPATMITTLAVPATGGTMTPLPAPASGGGGNPGTNPAATFAVAPRTIALNGIAAAGGTNTLLPRTIHIAGVTAAGTHGSLAARTIPLPALQAVGVTPAPAVMTGVPAPRMIALPGLVGTGDAAGLPSRTIALPGITAGGASTAPPPRTIPLPGFTAAGPVKTP